MAKTNELVWVSVDVASMPKALADKYAKLKAAQETARLAREAFEGAFTIAAREKDALDKDAGLAFGYRFGKLAVAKTVAQAPKAPKGPVFKF
jgi:hypothetical protein